jgi:hypothetical protein
VSDGKDVNDIVCFCVACVSAFMWGNLLVRQVRRVRFFSFSKLVSCIGMATSMFLLVVVAHAPLVAQHIRIPTLR